MSVDGGPPTTYCFDHADRLTSTTDSRYPTIAYDSRGNTTTLGDEHMTYDVADRHVKTTKGSTTVRYVRDATDRIVERRVNGWIVARYGYSADGDEPSFTLDAQNQVRERTISLLGGVLVTRRSSEDVWSYPNVHGDVTATAHATGTKQGATLTYDPYGEALSSFPDNSAGSFDYGWLGHHQRPVETEAGISTIEMGARPYVSTLGRFLQVDPFEGGSANDYEYGLADPVNRFDLDGEAVAVLALPVAVSVMLAVGVSMWWILRNPGTVRWIARDAKRFWTFIKGKTASGDAKRGQELKRTGEALLGRKHSKAGSQRWQEWYRGLSKKDRKLYRRARGPRPTK